MKRFFAALMFLTRAPLPAQWNFEAHDVGRGALCFPLVGALLGAVAASVLWVLQRFSLVEKAGNAHGLPPLVVAIFLVSLSAWLTGALHLDGLADMADGFGGGQTRDDVLRIMRDHVIGAYGGVALILVLALKIAAISTLIERGNATAWLVLAPMLARWASVPLGFRLPYARRGELGTHKVPGGMGLAITDYVGKTELIGATFFAIVLTFALLHFAGFAAWIPTILISTTNARWCLRRIGGITGDTLGANTEIVEVAVLLCGLLL